MPGHTAIVVLVLTAALSLASCGEDDGEARKLAEACAANDGLSSGKAHKIPNPHKQSSCKAFVMTCNYCEYDQFGAFKKSGFDVCGVCLATDF